MPRWRLAPVWLALAAATTACRATTPAPRLAFAAGHEIVLCGERVPVEAPVVLWTEAPFYDAYREGPRFGSTGEGGLRYRPGREARTGELAAAVARDGWTRAHLAEQVELLVLHYDACGTSAACFRVLQDERKLSVHFLLDLDGTLYQTLDLAETAWHARAANARSIGVEIAHVGAYPHEESSRLASRYEWTEAGTRLVLSERERASLRQVDLEARPAREGLLSGPIHGREYVQHDFTPEQYASLAALARALHGALPRIRLEAPRAADGAVRSDALSDAEEAEFAGILGHYHLQTDKRDPGPAFDWEAFLAEARQGGGAEGGEAAPRP